ncbi:WD40/YVTN/BNR-like repeat-containing protein [Mucilaginibacter psychrotolerans]|uniref:Oxidoreductase n=1 Tax=Mucilaginibacter psychrotolerans TaxID=1524096 RepID=A0A4Y8SEG9_9SPHI|nr:YCF48-related protein [Mucilaginibacter psychrotolerans]TFF37071.1 oxidoreductase [Mucilaginibacter psychrotolerans]
MKLKTIICAVLPALLFIGTTVKAQSIKLVQQERRTSMRGLSVVDDNIAWVSGSGGNVAISNDGGKTWAWQQLKGYEKFDFRDIEAFSAKEAVIMSSGTPAVILKTTDGGATWQEKYRKTDSAYFLDAMDFANKKHGFIMGDPINGKFLLLETKDGGETWNEMANAPAALKGEAAFAASGTCLRITGSLMAIVTGGSNSRLLMSPVGKMVWVAKPLPLTNGSQSMGAFSLATGKNQTIVVGGNYAKDARTDSVAYLLPEGTAAYQSNIPVTGPTGFQSSVEYLKDDIFISTGTPGSCITTNSGRSWIKIDDKSYNVCRKAKKGTLVLFAGDRGKIGIYTP